MFHFTAKLEIIGINPFVFLPEDVLNAILDKAGKKKGFIQVKGTVNNLPYTQTLVKYSGAWRLYINMIMLKNSPKRIGETLEVTIDFDVEDRSYPMHPKFELALGNNPEAKVVFESLSPSRSQEIVRYLSRLKNEEVLDKNVERAINFLLGKERFIGRDRP